MTSDTMLNGYGDRPNLDRCDTCGALYDDSAAPDDWVMNFRQHISETTITCYTCAPAAHKAEAEQNEKEYDVGVNINGDVAAIDKKRSRSRWN